VIEPEQSLREPGQGAMAIEIFTGRPELLALLAPLNHLPTSQAVTAERAVSKTFGGSCQIPLAAFATIDNGAMRLRAMVSTPDGKRIATADATGPADAPDELGRQIAQALQAQDAAAILAACNTAANA
jgi:hydroxymethylbilane synthase